MTTTGMTQITTSSGSRGIAFYFNCAVLAMGIVGTMTNGLILYAMLASKQHRKNVLIVNQNVFDLFSCLFLIINTSIRLCNIYLTGPAGYWLCVIILAGTLLATTLAGSIINLAMITVERYMRVVHSVWSNRHLTKPIIYSAMAFAWIEPLIYNLALVFPTTGVTDGACYAYYYYKSEAAKLFVFYHYLISYYIIIIVIFIFCYWRILAVIRRQTRVMASHGTSLSTAAQSQSNQLQTNVIKTMIYTVSQKRAQL